MSFDKESWTILHGTHNSRPLLIRHRQFGEDFRPSDYPERLNIFWKMSTSDTNGLASPSEAELLETFENRLVDAVERDAHSVLCVALTCDGKREFVFHTADVDGFVARLTAMPQEAAPYPIEIVHHSDPGWHYVDSVTRTV